MASINKVTYLLFAFSLVACLIWFAEPALANKFETIGGGVSGSPRIKTEHVRLILYAVSGALLLGAILSVVVPHDNPLFLNYSQWKQSAAIMFVLSMAALAAALLI